MFRPKLVVLLGALCLSGCRPADSASVDAERITAIVNVAVVPMDGERVLAEQTVLVRDGVIVEIGRTGVVRVPEGARHIDGTGMYLLPGLVDAHVHLRDPSELLSYLAHGVTTVVHLGGPTGNVPDVGALQRDVLRGAIPGPTIYRSGRILDGDPAIFPGVSTVVTGPAEAVAAVTAQLDAGADFIKVYNNLRSDALHAAVAAAHERGAAVWGHVPRVDGRADALDRALSAGLDVIAHGEEVFFTSFFDAVERQLDDGRVPDVSDDQIADAVARIRESGAAVTPNLSFIAAIRIQLDDPTAVASHPEARFLHPEVRGMWREQAPSRRSDLERFDRRERGKQQVVRRLTRMLQEAGVPLLLGTDASAAGMFPGAAAHVELEELVGAGLSAYEALATATRTPGRLFQEFGVAGTPFGTLSVGSRADLLMLEANPLSDVANARRIVGVMVRGEWYGRAAVDSMRAAAAFAAD